MVQLEKIGSRGVKLNIDLIYTLFILTLILVGVLSFTLFLRRLLINASLRNYHSKEVQTKLDRIIDLLEKERS